MKKLSIFTLVILIFGMMFSCNQKTQDEETQADEIVEVTKKDIGIQLYSIRKKMKEDPKATIDSLGKMGYTFVEAAGYTNGKFYGMSPTDFKTLVEANGMKFRGSHAGHGLPTDENRDTVMLWWDDCIAAHKEAGVEYIVQPWMGKEGYKSLDGLKQYCEYFEAVGEKCNAAGIRFGYHNHAKEYTDLEGSTIYDYMLDNTDPAKVMFQLDLYWIHKGGKNPLDYFAKYPGRFESWHIKDKAELGASGEIDFKTTFEKATEAGVKNIVVEVEEYNFDPLVSVQKSLEYLQNAEFVNDKY